jgi:predicted ATPase
MDLLTLLVNKSLVDTQPKQDGDMRYFLLETVRQYAYEKLTTAGEDQTLHSHHCHYFCWLAEQAEPQLRSAGRLTWTHKLILEHHNMLQALDWASPGHPLRAASSLSLEITGSVYGDSLVQLDPRRPVSRDNPAVSKLMIRLLLTIFIQ